MRDLINTNEMYLRTIYNLAEDGLAARQTRLVERLGQASTTVSQTVARMKRAGLVDFAGDRELQLTRRGWEIAVSVTRKHRLAERMFTDIVGLPLALVHDEACRLEHVMGEAVEQRLTDLLDHPTSSPWGNPIPSLDQSNLVAGGTRIADLAAMGPVVAGTVECVSEEAQAQRELVARFVEADIVPLAPVEVIFRERTYQICGRSGAVEIPATRGHIVSIVPQTE